MTKIIKFDDVTKEIMKQHKPNWPQISYHPYRLLIVLGYGSGKTNSLFHPISHQPNVDIINLYAKDSSEAKYQFSINKQESTRLKLQTKHEKKN